MARTTPRYIAKPRAVQAGGFFIHALSAAFSV